MFTGSDLVVVPRSGPKAYIEVLKHEKDCPGAADDHRIHRVGSPPLIWHLPPRLHQGAGARRSTPVMDRLLRRRRRRLRPWNQEKTPFRPPCPLSRPDRWSPTAGVTISVPFRPAATIESRSDPGTWSSVHSATTILRASRATLPTVHDCTSLVVKKTTSAWSAGGRFGLAGDPDFLTYFFGWLHPGKVRRRLTSRRWMVLHPYHMPGQTYTGPLSRRR